MEKAPLDRICIRELMTRTFVGFNDWERKKKQDVAISVTLHANLKQACEEDRVSDTIDYKQVKNRILQLVEGSRFSLIEAMAENIAKICLEDPRVARADVLVDKLGALRFARSVQVEITRFQEDGNPREQDS